MLRLSSAERTPSDSGFRLQERLFGKVFGKEDKKDSCCCDMEIVEVPEGEEAPAACECDSSGADAVVLTVLGPGCKRCHHPSISSCDETRWAG